MIKKLENVRKVVYDEWVILSCWLATWLLSWGFDSVLVWMHEILLFGNSAFYLNIMLECYQVIFGHYLGPRIIFIGAEFVEMCNLGFGSKF